MKYNAKDRKEWSDELPTKGWTPVEGTERVREFEAEVRVPIVRAHQAVKIVEPGAIVEIDRTREFVVEDPGEAVVLKETFGLHEGARTGIVRGLCFVEREGGKSFRAISGGIVFAEPRPGTWCSLPEKLSKDPRQVVGEELTARNVFEWIRTNEVAAEDAESAFGGDEILGLLRRLAAREWTASVRSLPARQKVDVLAKLAADDRLDLSAKDLESGLVLDLAADAVKAFASGASLAELIAFDAASGVPR